LGTRRTLLLSIHPRHACAIIAGQKRAELRRIRPRLEPGDRMLVYATLPVAAVVAVVNVHEVVTTKPDSLWKRLGRSAAVDREEFFSYFENRPLAHAICIQTAHALASPIALHELRRLHRAFAPPQAYWYLESHRLLDRRLLSLIASRCEACEDLAHSAHEAVVA
jgi:predicted transcriptional regulator